MKIGIMGGFLVGGLIACALIGIMGLVLLGIGILIAGVELLQQRKEERHAANWRASYPSYKY